MRSKRIIDIRMRSGRGMGVNKGRMTGAWARISMYIRGRLRISCKTPFRGWMICSSEKRSLTRKKIAASLSKITNHSLPIALL